MINRTKLENAIAEAMVASAQGILDNESAPLRQKLFGTVVGLGDMLSDLVCGSKDSDEEVMGVFAGDAVSAESHSDFAEEASLCRFHAAAATAVHSMVERIARREFEEDATARAGSPSIHGASPVQELADELDKAFADGGEDTKDSVPALPPTPSGKRHPAKIATERVNVDDVIAWSGKRAGAGEEIPLDDLVIEFYLKGGRDEKYAKIAAKSAMYKMVERGCAEVRKGLGGKRGNTTIITGYVLTSHGVFEAKRLAGPQFACDSNDQPSEEELLKELGRDGGSSDA